MGVVPAVGLGILVVFLVGAGITYVILEQIAKRKKGDPSLYWDTLQEIEKISLGGGVIAVVLMLGLLFAVPKEWVFIILIILTAIGILFGLSTFLLNQPNNYSRTETKHKPFDTQTRQESKRKRQEHQAENQARGYEVQRDLQELEKEHQKHQAEYQARVDELQRKQAELKAIRDDLYSLFGRSYEQSQRRGKLLEDILNRFFRINNVLVREAFKLKKHKDEGIAEKIDGLIEIDRCLYLVEFNWWKDPLGIQEVTPQMMRILNRRQPDVILISNFKFSQPAITTCQEILSQKIVVLCELEEIVSVLEQNGSLKDFLKAKIAAAVDDKNPFFKPLSGY